MPRNVFPFPASQGLPQASASRHPLKTRTVTGTEGISRSLRMRSIAQGSPLSPLLANIYMRRFVLGWKKLGLERRLGTRLVTYADDLVILCRRGNAEAALHYLRQIMGKLKLMVNEDKTRICKSQKGSSTSWGTRSGECTPRRPARLAWVTGHRRRVSSAWSQSSTS